MGFNSIRLSYAEAMLVHDGNAGAAPVPNDSLLDANPQWKGLSALEVFDAVVKTITDEGLLVVLSRRMRQAGWCCNGSDGSEVWYSESHTVEDWLNSLTFMANRYRTNKRVIGIDIFNEPRIEDRDDTIPWWGAPTGVTGSLGYRLADWRVGASQGAVHVWKGDPDALVIIEGQPYASNLEQVLARPLGFSDECLRSRIAFSSHEFSWNWVLDSFEMRLTGWFPPLRFIRDLRDALNKAMAVRRADEFGRITEGLDHGSSTSIHNRPATYEDWANARTKAAFFLHRKGLAPLWVSEFGTASKAGNDWWEHLLHYLHEHDISWCYWAMDPLSIPRADSTGKQLSSFEVDTYGVFDPSRRDYSAVVGWKLQDLVSIQAPTGGQLEKLGPPGNCSFDLEANLQTSAQPTSLVAYLVTMTWTTQALLCAWFSFALLILAPCLCWWCFCCSKRIGASNKARSWANKGYTGDPYETLNEEGKYRTNGNIIDARPVKPIGANSGSFSSFFNCCSTSGRPVYKPDRMTSEAVSGKHMAHGA